MHPGHVTQDSSSDPRRIGLADVDARAGTSWLTVSGPWIGLLPVVVLVLVVVVALVS